MDTSKKYIEMCEKAEEIQKEWKPKRGDFYTAVVHGKATDIINVYIDGFPSLPQRFIPLSELYLYLPRQDELQEMLAARGFSWLVITFFQFCKEQLKEHNWLTGQVNSPLDSLEKLWLAFVMKEKYKKTWNSKEWVKDEL